MNKIMRFFKKPEANTRAAYLVMLIFSTTSLIAAFTLTLEKFEKLANPNAVLSCSINLVLNCGTVMESPQSHVFGFPNMVIGLMAYASLITVAVAGLGGTKFPRWFMRAANIGIALGALFAYWLFFQSVYVIQVLCPWCLIVTFSTTLILASFSHVNARQGNFWLSKAGTVRLQKFVDAGYPKLIVFGWLVLLTALVFIKFGTALFA